MYNLKYIICLAITSILSIGVANAQNQQTFNSPIVNSELESANKNQELNNLLAQSSNTESLNPISRQGKPLNTPAATGGSDYDSNIVNGLEDYKRRKKLMASRLFEMQRVREEEFRRKAYEQALRAAQEREKGRMVAAGKKMSNQEYFDKQTRVMQGQK